jgi:competence protein ComGF
MSELTDIIFDLSKQFKIRIRPRSLDDYKLFADKIRAELEKTVKNINKCHNLYVYYFLKEKYPYLIDKDMADILGITKSNYSQRFPKWDFEIKTYEDVKANIEMLRNKI